MYNNFRGLDFYTVRQTDMLKLFRLEILFKNKQAIIN